MRIAAQSDHHDRALNTASAEALHQLGSFLSGQMMIGEDTIDLETFDSSQRAFNRRTFDDPSAGKSLLQRMTVEEPVVLVVIHHEKGPCLLRLHGTFELDPVPDVACREVGIRLGPHIGDPGGYPANFPAGLGSIAQMASLPPIMILDDDADDMFFVRRLLAKAGVRNDVVAFENPLGAADYLERECQNPNPLFIPCAIITDLNMPHQNGLDFVRWLQAHDRLKGIRTILITDSPDPDVEQRAFAAGASHFARKFPPTAAVASMLADLPCLDG